MRCFCFDGSQTVSSGFFRAESFLETLLVKVKCALLCFRRETQLGTPGSFTEPPFCLLLFFFRSRVRALETCGHWYLSVDYQSHCNCVRRAQSPHVWPTHV